MKNKRLITVEAMQKELNERLNKLEEETQMKLINKSSMGYKVLDLTTDRGHRIYADIASYYPSLDYGIYAGAEYIYAEGYTHVIEEDGVVNIITGETVWVKEVPIDKDPWYTPSGDEDIADDPFEYDPDYSPLIDRDAYTF